MQAYNEMGGAGERGKQKTVKPGPAIDAKLYKELVAVTKENGQSQRYQLERFIEPLHARFLEMTEQYPT